MRSDGNTSRAVTGTTGIEIPLEPRAVTPQQAAARAARQVATIETAEHAPAPGPAGAPAGDLGVEVRRLQAELARNREQITQLKARVNEQAITISAAAADVDTTAKRAELTAQLAAEQHQVLTARAEAAERDLAAAQHRIKALAADLVSAVLDSPSVPAVPAVAEPVRCEGGCGMPVAPEYVARTGLRRHGCCPQQPPVPVAAETAGPGWPVTRDERRAAA